MKTFEEIKKTQICLVRREKKNVDFWLSQFKANQDRSSMICASIALGKLSGCISSALVAKDSMDSQDALYLESLTEFMEQTHQFILETKLTQ